MNLETVHQCSGVHQRDIQEDNPSRAMHRVIREVEAVALLTGVQVSVGELQKKTPECFCAARQTGGGFPSDEGDGPWKGEGRRRAA